MDYRSGGTIKTQFRGIPDMLQQENVAPKFLIFLFLINVSSAAWSSAMRPGNTTGIHDMEAPLYGTRVRPAKALTHNELKAFHVFQLSPRDRQNFYLNPSSGTNAGVSLPGATRYFFIEQYASWFPETPYLMNTQEESASPMLGNTALVTKSRPSRIPPSLQWLAIGVVGIPLAFFGGAIVLAILVVATSLLSRDSLPAGGFTEEHDFTGCTTAHLDKRTPGHRNAGVDKNWQRPISNFGSDTSRPQRNQGETS